MQTYIEFQQHVGDCSNNRTKQIEITNKNVTLHSWQPGLQVCNQPEGCRAMHGAVIIDAVNLMSLIDLEDERHEYYVQGAWEYVQ